MEPTLFDSELKVMEILWNEGDCTAKRIAELAARQVGWSKTTTYTVIKKCLDKGALQRLEPNFLCRALVSREQAQAAEAGQLIDKLYGGAPDLLVASILGNKRLTPQQIARLKALVNQLEG